MNHSEIEEDIQTARFYMSAAVRERINPSGNPITVGILFSSGREIAKRAEMRIEAAQGKRLARFRLWCWKNFAFMAPNQG